MGYMPGVRGTRLRPVQGVWVLHWCQGQIGWGVVPPGQVDERRRYDVGTYKMLRKSRKIG